MTKRSFIIPGLLLGLTVSCGSSNDTTPPPPTPVLATGFAYTDPAGTGWRLLKDASSTSTRLVLNVVGPANIKTRGFALNIQAPASVKFGTFTDGTQPAAHTGWPIRDTGVYELRNTDPRDPWTGEPLPPDPLDPILLAGAVKKGNLLTAGVFQKDRRATAKDSGVPLAQIALEFDAAGKLNVGEAVTLTVVRSGYIPEDIGLLNLTNPRPTLEMAEKSRLLDMPIALGALRGN